MNRLRRLALLLPCLAGACLPAASADVLPPAVFRVLTLVPADGLLIDGPHGTPRPVPASSNRFSPPIPVPPDGNLELYRLLPPAAPGEPPRREVAVRAAVPAAPGAQSLLLLLPREGPPDPAVLRGPLRALVIDSSLAAHPMGQVRVFNLSTREAAVQLGDVAARIPSGRAALVPLPATARPWLSTATLGPAGWQRVSGGPLTLRPGCRLTLFMVDTPPVKDDDSPPGLSLFRVIDRPPPAPGAPRP